jgi:hypothetical protein
MFGIMAETAHLLIHYAMISNILMARIQNLDERKELSIFETGLLLAGSDHCEVRTSSVRESRAVMGHVPSL